MTTKLVVDRPQELPVIVCTITLKREPQGDEYRAFFDDFMNSVEQLNGPQQSIAKVDVHNVVLGRDELNLTFLVPEDTAEVKQMALVSDPPPGVEVRDVYNLYRCVHCGEETDSPTCEKPACIAAAGGE